MKTNKSKTLLLSLTLISFLSMGSSAQAQSFGGFLSSISDAAKEAANKVSQAAVVKKLSNDQTTSDSMVDLRGTLKTDAKWLLIEIKKDSYSEMFTLPVSNGQYDVRFALQDGAGTYQISLYQNTIERFGSSYSGFKNFKVTNTDDRDLKFLLPTFKSQSDDPKIIELMQDLTRNATSDEEAFHAIYNYVTSTVKYDWAAYNDGSYVKNDYNALAALDSKVAVCEGYANLIAALSRAYGIKTKVIFGTAQVSATKSGAHGWNEVFIDGEWKFVDATWDAGKKVQKYYFMDAATFAKDHFKEKEMNY